MKTRVQLSLFVPPPNAGRLEQARRLLDPVQARLIPAHVTLCREDELAEIDLGALASMVGGSAGAGPITLRFGGAEIFQDHGVLLPCVEGEDAFHELRCRMLGSRAVRRHAPHITVAHPRNPRSSQNIAAHLGVVPDGLIVTFTSVRHIRQEAESPWQVIAEQRLVGTANNDT